MTERIYVQVDQDDINRIVKKLGSMEKAPMKLKNAINRTATYALSKIKKGRSQGYTMNATRFNSQIKVQRANVSHLDASIKSKGKPATLSKSFKTSYPKAGGKADVTKSGLKRLVTASGGAAFIPSGGSASGLMAQRKGSERFPIKVLYGNSVPKMVEKIWKGERGSQVNMEQDVKKRLHDEMKAELTKLM